MLYDPHTHKSIVQTVVKHESRIIPYKLSICSMLKVTFVSFLLYQ